MPEIEPFQLRLAQKTLPALHDSIAYREKQLQSAPQRSHSPIQQELSALEKREHELKRLADKPTLHDVERSIKSREAKIQNLSNTAHDSLLRLSTEAELQVLRDAQHTHLFRERIATKNPSELQASIQARKKEYEHEKTSPKQKEKLKKELDILNKRQQLLTRLRNKSDEASALQSINYRLGLLSATDDHPNNQKRTSIEVELQVLEKTYVKHFRNRIKNKSVNELRTSILDRQSRLSRHNLPQEKERLGMELQILRDRAQNLSNDSVIRITPQDITEQKRRVVIKSPPTYLEEFDSRYTKEYRLQKLLEAMPDTVRHSSNPNERPAWLAWHNKQGGLHYFIQTERERLHQEGDHQWKNGAWETKWLSMTEMSNIAGEYRLPMVYIGMAGHARLVLEAPVRRSDGTYNVRCYDPMLHGEQIVVMRPKTHPSQPGFYDNMLYFSDAFPQDRHFVTQTGRMTYNFEEARRMMETNKYNLRIPTIPGKEWLSQAKMALTQTEGYNCTLWCIYHAAIASAMQPGNNTFKNEGLDRFEQKTGMRLLTYEDINNARVRIRLE